MFDFEKRRKELEPLVKHVQDLSRAAGRRLGDRPFQPKPDPLIRDHKEREVIVKAPDEDRIYKITENNSGIEGTIRQIETVDRPNDPLHTHWDLNVLPDEVIEDPLSIDTWGDTPVKEIRQMTRDITDGRELTDPHEIREFEKAKERGKNRRG